MRLGKHIFGVGVMTGVSRVFGFVRDMLIAHVFGAGRLSDVFLAAFKLPNLFRDLLGEGALSSIFIPMYTNKNKDENFAKNVFSWLMVVLLGITLLFEIFMPLVVWILAPGFADEPGKMQLTVLISRIMFWYVIFICGSAFLSAILNAFSKFLLVAFMPVLLNLMLIGVLLLGAFFAQGTVLYLMAFTVAVTFTDVVYPDAASSQRVEAAVAAGLTDVTGTVDVDGLREQYYNDDVVSKNVFSPKSERWVIVELGGDSIMDTYLDTRTSLSFTDYTDSYAATKKSGELMAHCYSKLYGIASTGLRFFTVYGPWGRPDMAPMLFADAISQGRPIKVFNGGDLSRDFTYIDDIIEGLHRVIAGAAPSGEVPCKIYNIGCSEPVRLMDFIRTMEQALGRRAEMVMLPMQAGDVYQTYADTSHLEHDYGYRPSIRLEDGIRRFVEWYRTENPLNR